MKYEPKKSLYGEKSCVKSTVVDPNHDLDLDPVGSALISRPWMPILIRTQTFLSE
jgi:hypothetical protein